MMGRSLADTVVAGTVFLLLLLGSPTTTLAFTTPPQQPLSTASVTTNPSSSSFVATTTSSLEASFQLGPWNLNKGENASPFGFDLNAEIWNGRVAQVSFVWVFLQESITGKGMLQGIERGDQAAIVSLGLFCMLIATLAVSFLLAPPPEKQETVRKIKAPRPDGWSDQTAFERAKSIAKMLDPTQKVDELLLNFNNGRSPFGLKKNAEVWNGRIAMISFLWVFAQELIERRGVTQSLEAHDTGAVASLVAFLTLVTGFTGVLVSSDESSDYVERVVDRQDLVENAKNPGWRPRKMDEPYQPLPMSSLSPGKATSKPPTFDQYQSELERALRSMNGEAPRTPPSAPILPTLQPMEVYGSNGYGAASRQGETPSAPFPPALQPMEVYSQVYAAAANPLPVATPSAPIPPASQPPMEVYASRAYSAAPPKRAETLSTQTAPGLDFQAQLAESYRSMTSGSLEVNKPTDRAPLTDRVPSVKLPDIEKVKEMVQSIPKPSLKLPEKKPLTPANFKVDGYRFKDTTRRMVVDTSPHPSGSFSFSADTTALIKENDETKATGSIPPTALKGNSIPHPVEGFKFGSSTKDAIQSQSMPATSSYQQEQQLPSTPLPQTFVSPEYTMPAIPSYPQEQLPSAPPPSPTTVGSSNIEVASPFTTTTTKYRPLMGSYLTALNQLGSTEQPSPSYSSSWTTTNEPAQQEPPPPPPQPQTNLVAPDYARIEVARTPYRPTMGSYLDAINKQGNTEQQPSPQVPPSYGFGMESESAPVAVAAPPEQGRRRVTAGSYLNSLSP